MSRKRDFFTPFSELRHKDVHNTGEKKKKPFPSPCRLCSKPKLPEKKRVIKFRQKATNVSVADAVTRERSNSGGDVSYASEKEQFLLDLRFPRE